MYTMLGNFVLTHMHLVNASGVFCAQSIVDRGQWIVDSFVKADQ